MNVYLINKEKGNLSTVKEYLSNYDYKIQDLFLTDKDLNIFKNVPADIFVFDMSTNLCGIDDLILVEKIREKIEKKPILLVTNNNESMAFRRNMLDRGVDVCLQFPFLKEELYIRVEKLLKKKNVLLFNNIKINISDISIDIRNHIVEKGGKRIFLTRTEYSILFHLFLHKNSVVATKELLNCLNNEDSSSLNIHIFNLRKKIGNVNFIKTVPCFGFTISEKPLFI